MVEVEGITYNMLWYRFSVIDHVMLEKLDLRPWFFRHFLSSHVSKLEGYDVVVAHSFTGALFAHAAHESYGVPYYVTWHGSDVHTHPWRVSVMLQDTRKVMEDAECNFFVSKALMAASDKITVNASKQVLYNGVSDEFVEYDAEERKSVRNRFGVGNDDRVVAFVGNLVPVKNVPVLPQIFAEVAKRFGGPLKFWIVGDGKLRKRLESSMTQMDFDISFWGNVLSEDMPAVMNSIDVLVLPSLNEGLPLVCAEAISCGAKVVGSDVGGIPEVVGHDNVVPLGDSFVKDIADKIVSMLNGQSPVQTLPSEISWSRTASLELSIMQSCQHLTR
jgi:glycosyltransferase involved in cell wall biosynthesis